MRRVLLREVTPLPATRPKLRWVIDRPGEPVHLSVDVQGQAAFQRAGLYGWVAPSERVRLYLFRPGGGLTYTKAALPRCGAVDWRHEAWFVEPVPSDERKLPFNVGEYRLARPIYCNQIVVTADIVEAMEAAELATRNKLRGWLGALL